MGNIYRISVIVFLDIVYFLVIFSNIVPDLLGAASTIANICGWGIIIITFILAIYEIKYLAKHLNKENK